jgi:16S rRNA (guanine527-N7)-methyltransferase
MQPDIRSAADFAEAFAVSRETIVKLETYAGLLSLWQKTINLVAPSTLENVWQRHFADSAQIVALAPAGVRTWVDLGSGGGFPGLVVAIMLADRPGVRVTLIESDSRKAAFLAEVARKVRVAVDIRVARIEIVSTRAKLESVDVVSARALAPLDRLLGLSLPFWGATTVGLYLKGKGAAAELKAAEARFAFDAELRPSLTEAEAHCVVVRNLRERR